MSKPQPPRHSLGYLLLRERHQLACLPHPVESYVVERGVRRTYLTPGRTEEIYPKTFWPGDSDFAHLEFALRHEGMHLQLLRTLLPRYSPDQVAAHVQSKPTSGYARRLWLLYEEFSGLRLSLPDVSQGNYVDLVDEQDYYIGTPVPNRRQRVNINLLLRSNSSDTMTRHGGGCVGSWICPTGRRTCLFVCACKSKAAFPNPSAGCRSSRP